MVIREQESSVITLIQYLDAYGNLHVYFLTEPFYYLVPA